MFTLLGFCFSTHAQGQAQELPAWLSRTQFGGDFRLRHEYNSQTEPLLTNDRHRERFRLRLGLKTEVHKNVNLKIRLATGDGASPVSSNSTFDSNAGKKDIGIDLAMLDGSLTDSTHILAGKIENPFRVIDQSQILYDADYMPEGLALTHQFSGFFVQAGAFILDERAPTNSPAEPDAWLLPMMFGFEGGDDLSFTLAGGYHTFTGVKGKTAISSFMGNSNQGAVYSEDYQVGELLAQIILKNERCHTSFYADLIQNLASDESNRGYMVGAKLQTFKKDGSLAWTYGYAYRSVDKNATVSSLNDSDFANAVDGHFGHMVTLGYQFSKGLQLATNAGRFQVDEAGQSYWSDLVLVDLQTSF